MRKANVRSGIQHARGSAGRELMVPSLDKNVFMVLLRAADVGVSGRDWQQMLFLPTFWN